MLGTDYEAEMPQVRKIELMIQDALSNETIYRQYRSGRRDHLRKYDWPTDLDPPPPSITEPDFLYEVGREWRIRYCGRRRELAGAMADTIAKDILVARIRARNSLYSTLPDLAERQLEWAKHILDGLDISTLLEIPSYGPSLISLWEDAKKQGLSDENAAEYIRNWGRFQPAAWARDAERKAAKQPLIDRKVTKQLAEFTVWGRTRDLEIPWEADRGGHHWQVRLNDFPDDYMYTLLIDGNVVGDFHDWPQAWDRGEGKTEVAEQKVAVAVRTARSNDPAALLSRYWNGEYAAVWSDLMLLGPEVRKAPYSEAARAVAQETMRRAAHNVNLLVKRLTQLDYRYSMDLDEVARPCTKQERKLIGACGRKRFWIPLSLQAFLQEAGWVDLMGSHPVLNPVNNEGRPLFTTDPLQITPYCERNLEHCFEEWSGASAEEREPVSWQIGADADGKSDMLADELPEDFYTIQLPNAAADAGLEGEAHKFTFFVEYLRLSFQWGGFPGWANYQERPEKELASLREGLLPL
jgi:hypothetical protein